MTLRSYVVWESEYPDEGSTEIRAKSPKEAKAKYRKMTDPDSDIELGAALLTPTLKKERNNRARADARGLECGLCRETPLRCRCAAFVMPKRA